MRWPVVCLLVALFPAAACSPASEAQEAGEFSITPFTFPLGQNALDLADLDGDGALDLISASQETGEIAIRLGVGAGRFGPPRNYPAGDSPTSLDSADFDADGRPDLAIANHEQRYLTIALGDGVGGIARSERIPLPEDLAPHVHMVRAADIDGDGAADLIVDSRDYAGAFVLINESGDALRFRAAAIEAEGAPYLGFALGDVDGDGAVDLVTPNANDVSILRNDRDSPDRFVLSQRLGASSPFSVALADVDGDGRLDLVAASESGDDGIAVFPGAEGGRFEPAAIAHHAFARGANGLAVADIDGDGHDDLIAVAWNGDLAVVFGGVGTRAARPPGGELTAPWTIATGDVNGDGREEFVVVDGASGAGYLYAWTGTAER